jgi:ADP-ribose pyrophosphatase YjhB (NUDIX family)
MAPLQPPTHAGGVVVRRDGTELRFLLVTARLQPNQWVLPKGHIEAGETAEQAAVREVKEEAGVDATVVSALGLIEFRGREGDVRSQFFLMEFTAEGPLEERRRRVWMTAADAQRAIPYEDARRLIAQAHEAVTRTAS